MFGILTTVALSAACALPPHPIDDVFGNTKVSPDKAVQMLVGSQQFLDVVELAIASAQKGQGDGLSFAQRVRLSIAAQLRLADDEGSPPEGSTAAASPLDEVIGNQTDAKALVKALGQSAAFAQIVRKAVSQSRPLPRGVAGPSFGQSLRIRLADELAPFQEGNAS